MPANRPQVGHVHWVDWDECDAYACLIAWFADPWTVGVVRCCPANEWEPLYDLDEHTADLLVREVPISSVHCRIDGPKGEGLAIVARENLAEILDRDEICRLLGPVPMKAAS